MFSNMASASSQATSKSKAETNGDKDHAENKKGEIRTETTKEIKQKPRKESMFADQLYKKLSHINGEVNRMSRIELHHKLVALNLDARGNKEVLKKRLKTFYKKHKLKAAHGHQMRETRYEYLLVIDFEATCTSSNADYQHEIIEFPMVLVDVLKKEVVDEFQAYCKPCINRQLTAFCTELTGITQKTVDQADTFPVVMQQAQEWMRKHELLGQSSNRRNRQKFVVVCDGPWDMSRFLFYQCQYSDVPFPKWAYNWVNIRRRYQNFYNCKKVHGLIGMLEMLGMTFEGQLHCGLDDARNIARIAIRLMIDGCELKVNEYLEVREIEVSESEEDSDNSEEDGAIKVDVSQYEKQKTEKNKNRQPEKLTDSLSNLNISK